MKRNLKSIQWSMALGAAGAWFGQHCGAGFASGLQEITYFVNAGWISIFTTLFPMVVIGIAFYFLGEYAREIHAHSYKDVASTLYSSNPVIGRIMLFVYDLIIIGSVLIFTSSTVAGAGTLLNQTLGWDYTVATVLFAIGIVVISMFGARVLAVINFPMSVVLIGSLLAIAVSLIGTNEDNLVRVFEAHETFGAGPVNIISNMLYYTLIQTGFAGAYMAIAGQFKSKTESRIMAISGIVINAGMLLLVSFAVLSGMPSIANEEIPILALVNEHFGSNSILYVFYTISLLLAYISTSDVMAATSRFGVLLNKEGKYNQILIDAILAVIMLAGSLLIAQLGIKTIVNIAYKGIGLLRGPVYLAGGLIFAPWRLHKMRAKKAAMVSESTAIAPIAVALPGEDAASIIATV